MPLENYRIDSLTSAQVYSDKEVKRGTGPPFGSTLIEKFQILKYLCCEVYCVVSKFSFKTLEIEKKIF